MISSYCHRLFCQNLILFLWQIVWIKHFQSEKQIGCNKNWLEFEENQMKVLQPKFELMRFLLSLFWMCNAILLALLGRCLIENNILPCFFPIKEKESPTWDIFNHWWTHWIGPRSSKRRGGFSKRSRATLGDECYRGIWYNEHFTWIVSQQWPW